MITEFIEAKNSNVVDDDDEHKIPMKIYHTNKCIYPQLTFFKKKNQTKINKIRHKTNRMLSCNCI